MPTVSRVLEQACLSDGQSGPCSILRPSAGPSAGSLGSAHTFSPTVRYDLNNPAKHTKLDFLNNLATGLVFIIVVVNIFITAFGVQKPVLDVAPQQ